MKRLLFLLLLLSLTAYAQQPINQTQINGTAVLTGNGGTGSGSQRVTIASDNTAFSVNATLSAETSKVIGTINIAAAQSVGLNAGAIVDIADTGGNKFTSNSNTFAAKFGLDTNLLGTLGTAFTTAGKVDIKGADGDVFVRQTTGSNLHAVTDTGSTTAVTQATGTNLHAVIDTGSTTAVTQATGSNLHAVIDSGSTTTVTQGTGTNLHVVCDSGCGSSSTISLLPAASGGLSTKHFVAAASDNATLIKGSAGQVYDITVYNNAAYPVYLKLYNTSSSPTGCGSTGLFRTYGVQAGTQLFAHTDVGWAMGTGVSYCLLKGITTADDTSTLASDAVVDISYN